MVTWPGTVLVLVPWWRVMWKCKFLHPFCWEFVTAFLIPKHFEKLNTHTPGSQIDIISGSFWQWNTIIYILLFLTTIIPSSPFHLFFISFLISHIHEFNKNQKKMIIKGSHDHCYDHDYFNYSVHAYHIFFFHCTNLIYNKIS